MRCALRAEDAGGGEFSQAWTYDLASGESTPLLQADWDVMFVFWSPSGRYRVSAINNDATVPAGKHPT